MIRTRSLIPLLALTLTLSGCGYNQIQTLDEQVNKAQGQIAAQLQRRADLIPNLVETVKGYASHEKGVFEEVTAARARVTEAARNGTVDEKAAAEAQMDKALVNVMAVAENYPDLKASTNFLNLQQQLADTENQLAFARQYYNDAVATLNKLVATIPWMFFAGMAGVSRRDFYQAPAGQTAPPTVSF